MIKLVDLREWRHFKAGLNPRLRGAIHHRAVLLSWGQLLGVVIVKVKRRRFTDIIIGSLPDRPNEGARLELIELQDAVLERFLHVYLADRGAAICGTHTLRSGLVGDLAINKLKVADLLKRLVLIHIDHHATLDLACVLDIG